MLLPGATSRSVVSMNTPTRPSPALDRTRLGSSMVPSERNMDIPPPVPTVPDRRAPRSSRSQLPPIRTALSGAHTSPTPGSSFTFPRYVPLLLSKSVTRYSVPSNSIRACSRDTFRSSRTTSLLSCRPKVKPPAFIGICRVVWSAVSIVIRSCPNSDGTSGKSAMIDGPRISTTLCW